MKIDVILRTHDKSEVHPKNGNARYCGTSKTVLIQKCVSSLIKTCNNVKDEIKIIWIDDHSSEENIVNLKNIFSKSNHAIVEKPLLKTGHNESALAQFTEAKNSDADLIYNIEDDYLHHENCMEEMIDSYITFKKNLSQEVAIHPFDDPDNYKQRFIEPTRIVLGSKRHWRLNSYTTFSFLSSPTVVKENWDLFYKLAKLYMTPFGEANNIHEGTTINKIWREKVILFTPIPSLALHMQYEEQKDKFINWQEWWNKVE